MRQGVPSSSRSRCSGPAGKPRDWASFPSLFHEGARLIPSGARPGGEIGARVLDPAGYIERSTPFFEKEGFYEREVALDPASSQVRNWKTFCMSWMVSFTAQAFG